MFYCFNIVFLLSYALMYATFRQGLRYACKISPKAKFKGAKNYWWFESVRESKKLGKTYYVNKVFTICYLIVAAFVILLGLFDFAKIIVAWLMGLLGVMLIPMSFFAWRHNNKREFGRPFVLFEQRKDGTEQYHSSIVDIMWSVFPVFVILFEIFWLYYEGMIPFKT